MTKILTGKYASPEQARNAFDALINVGFDREKVFLDRETAHVKVMAPDAVEKEARDILAEHGPEAVFERMA
jgi:hypothetical protein